jgi:peptidoglycan/LPS O-acetylase OafA/YrhL
MLKAARLAMGIFILTHRYYALDGIRGLCAIGIAAYHFCRWHHVAEINSLGRYGVYVFFILSALTLCIVYDKTFSRSITFENLRKFFVARVARIYPLLVAVSLAAFAMTVASGQSIAQGIARFALTATGLFAFQAPGLSGNAQGVWSLGIEIMFYIVFPILCLLAANFRTFVLVAVAAMLLCAQIVSTSLLTSTGSFIGEWPLYALMLSFAFYFAAGFVIYRMPVRKSKTNLTVGLVLLFAVMLLSLVYSVRDESLLTFPIGFICPLACGFGIFLISNSQTPTWAIRPFEFFGKISYSAYLIHPFMLRVAGKIAGHANLGILAEAAIFAILTIGIAYASYEFWEMPMRLWIRNIEGAPIPRPSDI